MIRITIFISAYGLIHVTKIFESDNTRRQGVGWAFICSCTNSCCGALVEEKLLRRGRRRSRDIPDRQLKAARGKERRHGHDELAYWHIAVRLVTPKHYMYMHGMGGAALTGGTVSILDACK